VGEATLTPAAHRALAENDCLEAWADWAADRAKAAGVSIAYAGESAYPQRLVGLFDAPPLLFHLGTPGAPRRRVAMVGSRYPDGGFLLYARRFAREVARLGLGVVSGAAAGVDRACHLGAIEGGAETWAFVGSALDELDPAQAALLPKLLSQGGVFYSELPCGVRASRQTFPRRNRLISGSADAVLVMRAGEKSGALYTATAALGQGRCLLAIPGDPFNEAAAGCNALVQAGHAKLCLHPSDVARAVGLPPEGVPRAPSAQGLATLSACARATYQVLGGSPQSFEDVLGACGLGPAEVTAGLVELELRGLLVRLPGGRYERV
jgi:DNA processing protein